MSVTLDIRLKRANKVYHEGVSALTLTACVACLANINVNLSVLVLTVSKIVYFIKMLNM